MEKAEILKKIQDNNFVYQNYKSVLCSLLEEILKSNNINYAFTKGRLKSIDSISNNFNANGSYGKKDKKLEKISDIKDLIGCRVVFYLKEDLERFIEILRGEFSIVEEQNKETINKYQGFHIVCELTKERLKLAEYNAYGNIPFEIQLTTVLFHGWNELEHDIFYKDKINAKKNFSYLFSRLQKQSHKIMEEYIIPAQQAWEGLVKDYSNVSRNLEVYSPQYLNTLSTLKDNIQIYSALSEVKDKSKAVGIPEKTNVVQILKQLNNIFEKSKLNRSKRQEIIKGSGYFEVRNHSDVALVIVEFLKPLFYRHSSPVIQFLTKLYKQSSDDVVKKALVNEIGKLASYNNDILKDHGFIVQYEFLHNFKKMPVKERVAVLDLICEVAKSVFSDDFSSSESSFDDGSKAITLTMSTHSFNIDDKNHLKLKTTYINFLKSLFKQVDNFEEHHLIIDTLSLNLYSNTSKEVAGFLLNESNSKTPVEILSDIEDKLKWSKDEESIKLFHKKVKNHPTYETFRVLVGYDRNFDANMSWSEVEKYRTNKINELVSSYCKSKRQKVYISRLIRDTLRSFSKINDPSAYIHFRSFMEKMSLTYPDFATETFRRNKSIPPFIMGSMLTGFLNSKLSIRNKKSYISNELELRYNSLLSLAYSLQNIKNNNLKKYTLLVILQNTRQLKTDREKVNVAHSSLCNLGFAETSLTKQYFELFEYLSSQNSFNWSNCYFEGREGNKNIFRAFNAAEWDSFLNLFVGKPDLGFHDVEILKVLADKYPNKILGYFKNRIQYDVAKLKGDRYSAVPYSDNQLHELFAKHEKDFVKQILKWYKDFEPWMVAHLLHDLYPTINQTLDKELRLLIDKKDKKIWKKRVSPLFTWYGKYEIEGIIEYTIRKFEKDESIWNECAAHLLNPGSVSGTAGEPLFANAIQGRVNSVKKWKQDTKKMKEFVALVEDWGSKRVESELISHNKEIMERRREYSD